MDMNHIKYIDLFMLKLCNLNGWKIVMQLNYIKCKFRPNHFFEYDRTLINVVAENNRVSITPLKTPWFRSLTPRVYDIESSHLYLYIALYKTDCVKAALECRTEK